jgi:hypothetical protein
MSNRFYFSSIRTCSLVLMLLSGTSLPSATVGAPNLGYLFDPSLGAIRPVAGIPGAAIVGPASLSVRNAVIAPGQAFALVDTGENEPLSIWRPDGTMQSLDGTSPVSQIVFSPTGNAAVLHSSNLVQVVTGLPDSPVVSQIAAPEGSRIFAVNQEGDVIAGGDLVWLLRWNESPKQLAVSGPISALAFQGSDLLVVGAGQILSLHNLADGTEYRTLATYADDRTPLAVQFSPDATRAFAATSDGEILVLSIEGQELARLACGCRPSGFQRLAGNSLFRVNEAGNGPIWLLDAAAEPRLWFVPKPLATMDPVEGSGQ